MTCAPNPRLLTAGLLALALTACGKPAADAPAAPTARSAHAPVPATSVRAPLPTPRAAASTTATAAAAPASTAFRVTAITLGRSVNAAREITAPATHFAPDEKTIYASVTTAGNTANATLSARWDYLRGAGQLITRVNQQLAADGPATTTFTLQNPDLWPEGKYSVQISLDGKPVATQAFEIGQSAK